LRANQVKEKNPSKTDVHLKESTQEKRQSKAKNNRNKNKKTKMQKMQSEMSFLALKFFR